MKILYINTCFWGGGAEKIARQLYYGIKDKDTETFFVAGRFQEDVPEPVKVIYNNFLERAISAIRGICNYNFLFWTYRARKEIIRIIKEKQIDIVHFHNVHGNYLGMEDLSEIKKYCSNIVFTMHDMWLLTGCCPYAMSCELWKKDNGCKNCNGNETLKKGTEKAEKFCRTKKNELISKGYFFISPSKWLISCCREGTLRNENIDLIENGVNINKYIVHNKKEMRLKYHIPSDKHVLLFSAHKIWSPYKGFSFLYDALMNLKDKENYYLIVTGRLENNIILPFSHVFMGYIKEEKIMNEIYASADLFLLSSMAETSSLVALESMASGTPVLAFKTGAVPEIVTDEVGWCVKAGDSKAFGQKIADIFRMPVVLAVKTGRCRRYVEENYSEDIMLRKYKEFYGNMLKK